MNQNPRDDRRVHDPTGVHLTLAQADDLPAADAFLPTLEADALFADKAHHYEERVWEFLIDAGIAPVIPPKANRMESRRYDSDMHEAPLLDYKCFLQAEEVSSHRHAL